MNSKEIIEEAVKNVKRDRQTVQVQITDLNKSMQNSSDMSKHATYGISFSKYVETLQRSNEQLIKLAELARKIEEKQKPSFDDDDDFEPDSLYDELKKEE